MRGCKHWNCEGIGEIKQNLRWSQIFCDYEAGNRKIAEGINVFCCDTGVNLLEIRNFGITKHLQPIWMQVLSVTSQGKTRFLYT